MTCGAGNTEPAPASEPTPTFGANESVGAGRWIWGSCLPVKNSSEEVQTFHWVSEGMPCPAQGTWKGPVPAPVWPAQPPPKASPKPPLTAQHPLTPSGHFSLSPI